MDSREWKGQQGVEDIRVEVSNRMAVGSRCKYTVGRGAQCAGVLWGR